MTPVRAAGEVRTLAAGATPASRTVSSRTVSSRTVSSRTVSSRTVSTSARPGTLPLRITITDDNAQRPRWWLGDVHSEVRAHAKEERCD